MNTSTNMERMIQLNNQGAFLIECGNYKKAIQCLRMGNHMLVQEMENSHMQAIAARARRSAVVMTDGATSIYTTDHTGVQSPHIPSRPILTFDVTGNSKMCSRLLEGHLRHHDNKSDNAGSSRNSSLRQGHSMNSPITNQRRRRRNHHYYYFDQDGDHDGQRGSTIPTMAPRGRHSTGAGTSRNSKEEGKATGNMTKKMMEEHEEPFISRRPIRVSCLPLERGDFCLSVIFLFNLALAHQLLARASPSTTMVVSTTTANRQAPQPMTNDKNNHHKNNHKKMMHVMTQRERTNVRTSLFLYQCAFTMKNKGNLHFDTSFVLAMVNNTANVLLELGYKERAKKLQQLMLSTLMMVVVENTRKMDNYDSQQDSSSSSSSSIILDDLEGFMATATQSMVSRAEQTTAMIA